MKTILKTGLALTAGVTISCLVCYILFHEVYPVASMVGTLPGLIILRQQRSKTT